MYDHASDRSDDHSAKSPDRGFFAVHWLAYAALNFTLFGNVVVIHEFLTNRGVQVDWLQVLFGFPLMLSFVVISLAWVARTILALLLQKRPKVRRRPALLRAAGLLFLVAVFVSFVNALIPATSAAISAAQNQAAVEAIERPWVTWKFAAAKYAFDVPQTFQESPDTPPIKGMIALSDTYRDLFVSAVGYPREDFVAKDLAEQMQMSLQAFAEQFPEMEEIARSSSSSGAQQQERVDIQMSSNGFVYVTSIVLMSMDDHWVELRYIRSKSSMLSLQPELDRIVNSIRPLSSDG